MSGVIEGFGGAQDDYALQGFVGVQDDCGRTELLGIVPVFVVKLGSKVCGCLGFFIPWCLFSGHRGAKAVAEIFAVLTGSSPPGCHSGRGHGRQCILSK